MWLGAVVLAAGTGAVLALASRQLDLFGLYDVAAALSLGSGLVAACHLAQRRPGRVGLALAAVAAVIEVATFQAVGADAFAREQARWISSHPELEVQDLAVAGVDSAAELVDAGLRIETGHDGLAGAWLAQWKAGIVVHRGGGTLRVLPAPHWLRALVLGAELSLMILLIWRALRHLDGEPQCPRCRRFMSRREVARVDLAQATHLAQAWQDGQRPPVHSTAGAHVAVVMEDRCPLGHTAVPGLALVGVRRRSWSTRAPGAWASSPAILSPP